MQVDKGAAQLADVAARLRLCELLLQSLRPDDALLLLLDEEVIELLQILQTTQSATLASCSTSRICHAGSWRRMCNPQCCTKDICKCGTATA